LRFLAVALPRGEAMGVNMSDVVQPQAAGSQGLSQDVFNRLLAIGTSTGIHDR
jgi:hypothetical protein